VSFSATERIAKNCQKFSGNITIQALVGRQHPYVLTPITEQARVSRSDWLSFLEEHHTEVNFFCSGVITRGTPWKPWGAWRQLDLRAAILILTEHLGHQSNKIHAISPRGTTEHGGRDGQAGRGDRAGWLSARVREAKE
jgi:hypothetical protein